MLWASGVALRDREKFAVPPGDTVCGDGVWADGTFAMVSGYDAETAEFACETALISTNAGEGGVLGAV